MFKIREDPRIIPGVGKFIRKHSMASVIIGTPGAGEPTNSLSSAAKTSFDQQFYDRRPEVSPATQSIIPAPNSCLFTFFGGSRKAQYELEARADGADQGGSPWRGLVEIFELIEHLVGIGNHRSKLPHAEKTVRAVSVQTADAKLAVERAGTRRLDANHRRKNRSRRK